MNSWPGLSGRRNDYAERSTYPSGEGRHKPHLGGVLKIGERVVWPMRNYCESLKAC
jgi:hypothetical protein